MKSLVSRLGLDVFDATRSYPIRNFFVGALVASIIIIIGIIVWVNHRVSPALQGFVAEIPVEYPDDLVITIKDGIMSSSYDEPYVYSTDELIAVSGRVLGNMVDPNETARAIVENQIPRNIFYIDDTRNFSLDHFQDTESLLALYRDTVVTIDDKATKVIPYGAFIEKMMDKESSTEGGQSFSNDEPFIIDQATIEEFLGETAPRALRTILPLVGIISFMIVSALMLLKIIPILIVSLVVFLVWRTQKSRGPANFKHILSEAMHGSVIPFIITAFVIVVTMSPAPWVFGGLLLVYMLVSFLRTSQNNDESNINPGQSVSDDEMRAKEIALDGNKREESGLVDRK